jgi:hypothetical protein
MEMMDSWDGMGDDMYDVYRKWTLYLVKDFASGHG